MFKNWLSVKNITKEQFDEMTTEKQSELQGEYLEHLESEIGKKATSDDVTALKSQIEELKNNSDVTAVKTEIGKLEQAITALKEGNSQKNDNEPTLVKSLKENMDSIKQLAKGVSSKEVTVKADTLRANIDGNQQAFELGTIGQLATRRLSMYDLFAKIPVGVGNHNGTIRYYDWDEDTITRAATMIAEGDKFPESEAKWKTYTLPLRKVGDTLPVSEEFYEDAPMFAAELENFLLTNVDLKVDDQICNGNNTGQNLKGLFSSSTAFNAALVSKVEDATFYDLLAVGTEQITVTGGAKYMPNFVVMRKSMINKMRLTKDKNENYIIPPFVSRDGREVDGMLVIESNIVPDNQMVFGDSRFARIYEMSGISLDRGFIGDQFAEDMETLKVRKRLLFLIREADKGGFIKVTDIDAAIVAITAT